MSPAVKIVCSTGMPFAREAFGTLGDTVVKDGRSIVAGDVRDADILAIRSTTRVDRALLDGSTVKFVGTATIGFDHIDTPYLESRGVKWRHSPGCNANSVSEYVATALLCLAHRHGHTLAGKTIGVIGVGNVGSRVVAKARALGMRTLRNDPPRQRLEARTGSRSGEYVALDDLLAQSDIVTLHVPLTDDGAYPTRHMADAGFFARMKPRSVFLNTSRGAVTDTAALLAALSRGAPAHAVNDTWENEPAISAELLDAADIATPHIAGYSFDGKVNGTVNVYRHACAFLRVAPGWSCESLMPETPAPSVIADASEYPRSVTREEILWQTARRVYDIESDDRALRAARGPDAADHFDRLRRDYPDRREFHLTRFVPRGRLPDNTVASAAGLGFQVDM